ncbi:general secretion pathway protein D [Bryocella elongata]|uniref:General secretion pathway protein D n=1 Tax=Bryocella elongata TaxID=863522 RepID=A0A1H5SIJ5_9BACT|nr:cohesin domain-containing protein [Bryocella elongata]SEF50503.1 general secretion pathway protein D [Bryocella elongata]
MQGRRMGEPVGGRKGISRPRRSWAARLTTAAVMALALGALWTAGEKTAQAQSASTWNKRGEVAEARDDFDTAFEAFRQAHLKKPTDLRYRERYERLRFEAANQHVDRGRVMRQSGDAAGAINEFTRALQIDPGNQAAAQELQQTQKASPNAGSSAPAAAQAALASGDNGGAAPITPMLGEQTPYQKQVQRDILTLATPVSLRPVSEDPITLHMVEDTKVVYQAIGKAAGLNVIFDPDYSSKRVPVDLTSVSLYDALRIVGMLSGTFWKPVTPNTIFVAQNNRAKRTDLDDMAVQTFYLTNVSQQNDSNEILVALRNLLDPSVKIYLVASQNAIILRATPDELILAEKLINDLDRTRAEVVIDVAVLEVSRNKERDLGITLPTSIGLTPQESNYNQSSSSSTSTTSTSTTSTSTTSGLTLNTLANLNATNFAVTLSGGTVNALLTDADTRILQNPRIRATDGQHSTLKIGSKIPVATGSYSSTLSAASSYGVQTQFTYLDVGVNIDITPTVHYDREISLKLKIEVSAQNGSVTISSVTEPIISQRVSEQVIQLKDGEPSILAGLLQKQDSTSVNGTPGLASLPFFKYFFSSQDKTTQQDEIVFLVIPHIVREQVLTDENTEAVYTGTSQSIELMRKDPAKIAAARAERMDLAAPSTSTQETSAARAASAMVGAIARDGSPIPAGAGTVPPPTPPAANAGGSTTPVSLQVIPPSTVQTVGSTFQVVLKVTNARDLSTIPLQMQFNPKVLQLVGVEDGTLMSRDGQPAALVHRDGDDGSVTITSTRPPQAPGVNGEGSLCTLTFKAIGAGDSPLALVRIGARDSKQNNLPTVGSQGVVHVK